MTGSVLMVGGDVRLSTLLAASAFAVVAATRREWGPLLAGWAWLAGFEVAFQAISLARGSLPVGPDGPIFLVVLGVATVPWATWKGARPSPWVMVAALAAMAVWVAAGFHVNGHAGPMDPAAEALNEGAKTVWALAYLTPLLWRSRGTVRGATA